MENGQLKNKIFSNIPKLKHLALIMVFEYFYNNSELFFRLKLLCLIGQLKLALMKAIKFTVIFLLFLSSCAVYKDPNLENLTLTSNEKQFISAFENAAVKHKVKDLKALLHPVYVDQELNEIYGGDARALFNSFFCGKDTQTQKFVCLKLRNVRTIELIKIKPGDEQGEKHLIFRVEGYDHTIIVDLFMKKYSKDGQAKLGIIGAMG